jgi:CysZ protein
MKQVALNHIEAFKIVFKSIVKNYWYWFFAPGLMIGIFYWITSSGIDSMAYDDPSSAKYSWVASTWDSIVSGISSLWRSLYKFMILTLLSPLNAFFTEIMDSKLTKRKFEMSFGRILKDVWRAILIFGVALMLELVLWIIFSLIGKITGLGLLSDIITFISGAFFIGLSFYDYALERHRYSFGKSWKYAIIKAPYMIICGLLFELLYLIPIVGIVIAPVILSLSSTVLYLIMDENTEGIGPYSFKNKQLVPESEQNHIEE